MLSDIDYWSLVAIWISAIVGFFALVIIVYLNVPYIRIPDDTKARIFWIILMVSLFLLFMVMLGVLMSAFNII